MPIRPYMIKHLVHNAENKIYKLLRTSPCFAIFCVFTLNRNISRYWILYGRPGGLSSKNIYTYGL